MLTEDSTEQVLPEFDTLAQYISEAGGLGSPAELHGCLCGHLAAGGRYQVLDWVQNAAQLLEIGELNDRRLTDGLVQLYQATLEQFCGADFQLHLLLPDDESAMSRRSQGLGFWCHGFLSGYALAGGQMQADLSEDARDALEDMVQIAQLAGDGGDEDAEEADFTEVYEYVRMSALLIFSECNEPVPETHAPAGESLH